MRKGYRLEQQIQKVLDYVNGIGYHAHKNHPKRTVDGVYLQGECFDYEVFLPTYKAVFDAKECKDSVWRIGKKDLVQAEHLMHCHKAGLKAYFLIQFGAGTFPMMVFIQDVQAILANGAKGISENMGIKWDLIEVIKRDYG